MGETQGQQVALPRIYPITDRRITGLSHCEQVKRLAAGGAQFIQLREKYLSPREFYEEACEAIAFAHANGIRILINDRVDIALACKADGVHLGQTDLAPSHARKILGTDSIIGYSTHSVTQAVEAMSEGADYLAIGPVFPTGTKENPDEVVGTKGVAAVRAAVGGIPLVAIGGISETTVGEVLLAGADSAAIVSAILNFGDGIAAGYTHFSVLGDSV